MLDDQTRWRSIVIWVLAAGMLLALGGNVYQFIQGKRLTRDFTSLQSNVNKQFAEMRELESSQLEQSLRRIDDLSRQLEGLNQATIQQTEEEIRRTRLQLAKELEQRKKEVAKQLTEMKTDLKQDANARVSQVSNDLEQTRSELQRSVNNISAKQTEAPVKVEAPPVVTHAVAPPLPAPAPAPEKKSFWNKLNPFRSHKAKTDIASK
jgi:HD-GYP domain-containing protein (c-di-GMP phosphodiesterase class II)